MEGLRLISEAPRALGRGALMILGARIPVETVEKPASERLMENVHMQGLRNWGPARRVGSPSEARTNPEE